GERGLPILTSEFGRALPPSDVKTDWTVRFYKWDPVGKPYLGVYFFGPNIINPQIARIVPNGPAAKAGLRVNDVIVAVGEKKISDHRAVTAEIQKLKVGDNVTLK